MSNPTLNRAADVLNRSDDLLNRSDDLLNRADDLLNRCNDLLSRRFSDDVRPTNLKVSMISADSPF